MRDRPWESEPDELEFEAEGLPCVMRRNDLGVWCGYVGVGPDHPLFGLPFNHTLKLPASWFEHRRGMEGAGPIDFLIHVMSDKQITDACAISLALQVHGGITYSDDHIPLRDPSDHWWFGFDCGHGGDKVPHMNIDRMLDMMVDSMPEETREFMREIVRDTPSIYRDQQYVVAECQSLAAQLVAIVKVLEAVRTQAT